MLGILLCNSTASFYSCSSTEKPSHSLRREEKWVQHERYLHKTVRSKREWVHKASITQHLVLTGLPFDCQTLASDMGRHDFHTTSFTFAFLCLCKYQIRPFLSLIFIYAITLFVQFNTRKYTVYMLFMFSIIFWLFPTFSVTVP